MGKKFLLIIIGCLFTGVIGFSAALAQDEKLPPLKAPDLKVSIPGAQALQDVECSVNTLCNIPWLGQYIAALQSYAVGIIGIVAVIVLMLGGVVWLTAGGNQSRIEEAKKMIGGSIAGIFIAFGGYLILYVINPELTVMKSLQVLTIQKIDLLAIELEGHSPQSDAPDGKPIGDSTFDTTFKNFAACAGVDWRLLKGIAYKESHLSPTVVNSDGFTGLFQTKQIYCRDSVAVIGFPPSFCNAGVKDPAVNTAIATGMLKTNLGYINNRCSSISDTVKIFMIYYGHSSGGGALKKAINTYGCNPTTWPSSIFKGATKDYVNETVDVVLAQGVTNISNTSQNGRCPN